MPIHSLHIKNFKGIAAAAEFTIAPLTLFVGPNSSGKSSCIHALAALAQTVKLGERTTPLVLDDDAAHVHLGRFIEIVHSKSYRDEISLGLGLGNTTLVLPPAGTREARTTIEGDVCATYSFGSSKRTQELFISSATLSVGSRELSITQTKGKYRLTDSGTNKTSPVDRQHNFMFEMDWRRTVRETFETAWMLRFIQDLVGKSLLSTLYLGPFRQAPRRRYPFRGSMPSEVGAQGEAAVSLLASEHVQSKRRQHTAQIARWLDLLRLGTSVSVGRVGTSDLFGVDITLPDQVALPIADLGYGVSQVLPVLAQCSFAKPGSTLLFEQPELHLHPGAARRLTEIFADVIAKKRVHIIAETHSQDLFLEVFRLLRDKKLQLSDVAAYDVKREDKHSVYVPIQIMEVDGHFECEHPWSKGLQS